MDRQTFEIAQGQQTKLRLSDGWSVSFDVNVVTFIMSVRLRKQDETWLSPVHHLSLGGMWLSPVTAAATATAPVQSSQAQFQSCCLLSRCLVLVCVVVLRSFTNDLHSVSACLATKYYYMSWRAYQVACGPKTGPFNLYNTPLGKNNNNNNQNK